MGFLLPFPGGSGGAPGWAVPPESGRSTEHLLALNSWLWFTLEWFESAPSLMPSSLPPTPPAELRPAVIAADPAPQQPVAGTLTSAWAYSVEAYGFLPWLTSTTTVKGFTADTSLSPGQLLNLLQSVASVRGSVEHDRIGMIADLAYTQLGAARSTSTPRGLLTGRSSVTAINGVYDLALRYRFGQRESPLGRPGDWSVIPYAGVRLVQAELGVEAQLQGQGPLGLSFQRQGTLKRTWAQPLLGSQASLFLSPALRLFARGDVGGFGLAGSRDLSGNAQVGLGYAIGNNTDLNLSWRYQGLAFRNGAQRPNGFTSDQNGVEIGVKFFF